MNKRLEETVTLTIPTQLVQKHVEKILPGNGISITNFNILSKTVYDRGDCDQIISLNETSIVEKNSRYLFRILFRPRHNYQPTCTEKQNLLNWNHWCSCHTREKTWLATHYPYKRSRVGQRQGNGTILDI